MDKNDLTVFSDFSINMHMRDIRYIKIILEKWQN